MTDCRSISRENLQAIPMAKESTFPADDVPDRSSLVLEVLKQHDPVPVPVTTLYLGVEDKRALAGEFERLEQEGRIERDVVRPGDARYDRVHALLPEGEHAGEGPVGVYRLAR